jgi:hypothetical protein
VTCDRASQLIDDYLEKLLSPRQCGQLEQHFSACPRCAGELRDRIAFERNLQQTLTASVHHLQLTPDASQGLVQSVEASLAAPRWPWSGVQVAQVMGGTLVAVLLVIGSVLLVDRVPAPLGVQQALRPPVGQPALSVDQSSISFQPYSMAPGDRFTITIPIESDLLQGMDTIRCDLDIDGPTGKYRFVLLMQGPLPARGLSVLQVTPDLLAAPSQQQYQMSPAEIFGQPGAYDLRVTLFSPVTAPVE